MMKTNLKSKLLLVLCVFVSAYGLGFNPELNAAAESGKPYVLSYDKSAPLTIEGWEFNSLPLGNGYFGVSFFGGVAEELWQFSEKSVWMKDPDKNAVFSMGLSSVCELRLSMDHGSNKSPFEKVCGLLKKPLE